MKKEEKKGSAQAHERRVADVYVSRGLKPGGWREDFLGNPPEPKALPPSHSDTRS